MNRFLQLERFYACKLPLSRVFQAERQVLEMLCCYKVYWLIGDYVQPLHGQEYSILKQKQQSYRFKNSETNHDNIVDIFA